MDRVNKKKCKNKTKGLLVCVLMTGMIAVGGRSSRTQGNNTLGTLMMSQFEKELYSDILKTYTPAMTYDQTKDSREYFKRVLPLYSYMKNNEVYDTASESELTYEMIRAKEAADENHVDEKTGELVSQNKDEESEKKSQKPVVNFSKEKLADFDYVMNQFFILDSNTETNAQQISGTRFLGEDLSIKQDSKVPQILIYHTHSQETFVDSREGKEEDTIVGVGNYLTDLLEEKYGYQVIHVTDAFDMMGGTLDRSKAYDYARISIEKVLEENPTVEVVIDLHRDGVPDDRRLVTEVNGKSTAQLLFYNGLSYTVNQGAVSYLPNPYIEENLAFSFQLEYQAAQYYPDLYRGIYLAGLRYNLHLKPRALLLEAGAQTNTVEEVRNAMEPFADILNRVLKGSDKED